MTDKEKQNKEDQAKKDELYELVRMCLESAKIHLQEIKDLERGRRD